MFNQTLFIMAFKFEKLKVWLEAMELSGDISDLVKKFPKDELYVLTSHLKRAGDSISLNIAEGSTGQTDPEFSKFLGYAIRSAIEVVACFFLAKRRNLITEEEFSHFYDRLTHLIKGIQALRNTLR